MPIVRFAAAIVAGFIILFLGCQHAAIAYRLRRDGLDPIVLPPTTSDNASQSVSIAMKRARQRSPKIADCDITGEFISLYWEQSTAKISFRLQPFFTSADESGSEVGRRMYIAPLLAIDKLRSDLAERQSRGCLTTIEGERLRRAIVENLPLPPAIAYFLELGSYDVTGYFDLGPDFRMQVTSPIYPAGAAPSPGNLLGYETANYTFIGEGPEGRTRLHLTSASEVLIGGAPTEKRTVRNKLGFSESPSYFRLLFMTEETATHRISRAILLSAPDQNRLAQAVARRGTAPPDDFCAALSIPELHCTAFPENFGVSPELRIRVNEKDAFVRVGGMVQEVLNLQDREAGPPTSLKIFRPFHGRLIPIKFDKSSRDILSLVLLPGDQVTF